jgi:hypothetical protein
MAIFVVRALGSNKAVNGPVSIKIIVVFVAL